MTGLSVRTRIALSMALLLAITSATAATSWALSAQAGRMAERSRKAASVAQLAVQTSARVGAFVGDARALALSVSTGAGSEDVSEEYGAMLGSGDSADRAFRALCAAAGSTEASAAARRWDDVRLVTYVWINAQAAENGSAFRMTRAANGRYLASVSTSLVPPAELGSADSRRLKLAARDRAALLEDASLRALTKEFSAAAEAAAHDERTARDRTRDVTIALVIASLFSAVVATVWLYRTIATPLAKAREVADEVAAGDLDVRFSRHTADEIGVLTHAVENMTMVVASRIRVMHEMAGAVLVIADDVHAEAASALSRGDAAAETAAHDELGRIAESAETLGVLARQMLEA